VRDRLRARVQELCGEAAATHFPYLARLMSLPLAADTEARLSAEDGQQIKGGTFQAIEALLRAAARQRPLVWVCEDLHWADASSLELLEHVLSLMDRASLLLICAFRPDASHGSWQLRETVRRLYRHRHTDLELRPLSAADSQTLVRNLLRVEDLPDALRERIVGKAEGNPFYVEEVIRALMDSGAIARDAASRRWVATREVAEIAIPDTLQGVLLARLDRLQEDTRRVLQMAAVIGRVFLYRVLQSIATQERELDHHLSTLQYEELIRERARLPELEYIFKHELTREAAYNGILKRERRAFHRQVAEALERLFPERVEEQLGLLAYHWECAGDAPKATEYLLRAGDQARLVYAHAEAVNYYQRALTILKHEGKLEQAARTWMKLGLAHHAAFDFKRSRQAYDEGFALWQQAQRQELHAVPRAPQVCKGHDKYAAPTLDIALARDIISRNQITQLFSGLVEYTPEMDIVPDVADSWEVLDDGRRYLFHLRTDTRWSDGAPVTAHDFEYSIRRWLAPTNCSGYSIFLYDIRGARAFHEGMVAASSRLGVRAVDDWTLAVELEEPVAQFLHIVARLFPVPRHVVQARGAAWADPSSIVTNGPYRIESHDPHRLTVVVRNPDYRGRFTGNVQRSVIRLGLAPERLLEMYEADEIGQFAFLGLPLRIAERVRQKHADEYIFRPNLGNSFVAFNDHLPPFHDPRVRRAFVLATDKEALAQAVLPGYLGPAMGGFVPPGIPGHTPGTGLPYDPAQARALLAEAGYPWGQGFPAVEAWMPVGEEREALELQSQWRETLGVDVPWRATDVATLVERLSTDPPQICMTEWSADYPDPRNFLEEAIHVRTAWRNDRYDQLLRQARRLGDQAERMRLYRQAESLLIEEAAVLPLFYDRWHWLRKPWIKVPISVLGRPFWKDMVIDPH